MTKNLQKNCKHISVSGKSTKNNSLKLAKKDQQPIKQCYKTAKTMTNTISGMLNLIQLGTGFQKMLKYLILKKLNRYQG